VIQAVVLDSEALSKAVLRHRDIQAALEAAWQNKVPVLTSAATLVEVIHPRIDRARLRWLLSLIAPEPITSDMSWKAAELLMAAGLHGHKYAIDAMLAVTALQRPGNVLILTSDVDDLSLLCGKYPRVIVKAV
jgi:predicted nucleic acid-binding protein